MAASLPPGRESAVFDIATGLPPRPLGQAEPRIEPDLPLPERVGLVQEGLHGSARPPQPAPTVAGDVAAADGYTSVRRSQPSATARSVVGTSAALCRPHRVARPLLDTWRNEQDIVAW